MGRLVRDDRKATVTQITTCYNKGMQNTISECTTCRALKQIRIWRKEHESMDPSCLVSTVQAGGGGVMVWGIFSWHTLGPLIPIEHCLNATAYLNIVA